jgi:hypothetical protein
MMLREQDARIPYPELHGLEHVYLEDSYVLDLCVSVGSVEFTLDVVLTSGHALYQTPSPEHVYCMRQAVLRFSRATTVQVSWSGAMPATDAAGEVDYGNIDVLYREGARYHIGGPWGDMDVVSDAPVLDIS